MKPILFNQEMIKAIFDGRKTVTRRLAKGITDFWTNGTEIVSGVKRNGVHTYFGGCTKHFLQEFAPFQSGDILYVRETYANTWSPEDDSGYVYKADGKPSSFPYWGNISSIKHNVWRPSIHMPKEAARIFLRVSQVKVERLQDITEDDARKEGCIDYHDKIGSRKFEDIIEFDLTAKDAFAELWNSTIPKRDPDDMYAHGWKANPWVWVIEFERITKEEAVKGETP